ncbi:hypothetical protein SAMN05444287_0669 [Octadecabacter temperatus]|uniref:Uncharacterized protein n=1 Tax=Octadecabacter temperatus TaxID=1458307 RepID=A0A0K0Y3M4_9RHOB|nr:hypothetical protein [Octadecabacter temperatus]AKS45573.1 hypothetical protein OSB_10150 [Octadecabacter temperatus]SIN95996.1 hypothetical protein SAMN05444287_0669 [Octadecabacter temperatus]
MIRLAFLLVTLVGGLIAFGAFYLVRGSGTQTTGTTAAVAEQPIEAPTPAPEPEPDTSARLYFLADQYLDTGEIALVLDRAGPNGTSVVITDPAAIKNAQDLAFVNTETTGGEVAGAIVLGAMGVPLEQRIAALFRDDELVLEVTCGSTTCGDFASAEDADFAGLLDAAEPLVPIEEYYDTYATYLEALAFIANEPDYALLGLKANRDQAHPVPQAIPEAIVTLPTIHQSTSQPLDTETHAALLSALVQGALPEGVTISSINIEDHGAAILVDADNGLPATRAGAEIPFPDVLFYTPHINLTGASSLPDDLLETLTSETLSRVEWDDASKAFIQDLGLTCTDCYNFQIKGDVYDEATVIHSVPERYDLTFYDLRDAP